MHRKREVFLTEGEIVFPMQESWDTLIVLDACRYDYFKKVYRDYIEGHLTKRLSPGTNTGEWCERVFTERYEDVLYVSANIFIKSNRIRVSKELSKKFTIKAEEHFYKVIDVWRDGWSDDLGTVHPETVNQYALDALKRYPDKRLIVHYMQPHAPYLTMGGVKFKPRIVDRILAFLRWRVVDTLKIGGRLGLPVIPKIPELVVRSLGSDCLRKAYEDNLRIVMKHVTELIDYLQGKIVITADHGELLGEKGYLDHCSFEDIRLPPLVEIPWLEVTRACARKVMPEGPFPARTKETIYTSEEEEEIKKRLKSLGYL